MIAAMVMAFVIGGDTPLDDSRQEARAQALMREIRCVVCENEPVSHSTADIAVDMRRQIRTQVASTSPTGTGTLCCSGRPAMALAS
jgi:cytochrome c-type biogenesis protein CcmH